MDSAHRFRAVVAQFASNGLYPTERELLVARLALIDGLTHRQIASVLGVSPGTVKAHLAHFSAKVGLPLRLCRVQFPRVFWSLASATLVNAGDTPLGE